MDMCCPHCKRSIKLVLGEPVKYSVFLIPVADGYGFNVSVSNLNGPSENSFLMTIKEFMEFTKRNGLTHKEGTIWISPPTYTLVTKSSSLAGTCGYQYPPKE